MRLPVQVLSATAASLALVGAAAGWAVAETAADPVRACSDKQGRLRVLTGDAACTSSESALTWAVQGPRGVQGVPGPQGAPGLTSVRVAQGAARTVAAGATTTVVYGCPGGGLAVSASPQLDSALQVLALQPTEPPSGYQLLVRNTADSPRTAQVTLVCAQVAPGVLRPGRDVAATQEYADGRTVGEHTPASSTQAAPPAVPVPAQPWSGEGALTWSLARAEGSSSYTISAQASGLMPGVPVEVSGVYTRADGTSVRVGHTAQVGPDGRDGVGHSDACGSFASYRYTFTQGAVVQTGTAKAPC